MSHYLLVEDNETQWQSYHRLLQKWITPKASEQGIRREDNMFHHLESHPLNTYFPDLGHISSNLREAMEGNTLDLLISDIALGGDENYNNDDAWIDVVLKDIVEQSQGIQQLLRQRNMGLIIMTRHSGDIIAKFIQRAQVFLNTWFPGWVFLSKNTFTDGFRTKFNELAASYQVVQGSWCHLSKVHTYKNLLYGGRKHYFERMEEIKIIEQQIIAIEAFQDHSIIYYSEQPTNQHHHLQVIKFETYRHNKQQIEDEFKQIFTNLNQGIPGGFDFADAYFLHIKQQNPFTLINQNFIWIPSPNNHGRTLTLSNGTDQNGDNIEVHCRFDWLNDYFPIRKKV